MNSLYTNIIQEVGVSSAEWALQTQTNLQQDQINYILERLRMAMSHNYFWYKGEHYTQTKGVAMGTKYAPSVANLFLNRWEEEQIYRFRRTNLKLYRRYMDNIIIKWRGTEEELKEFLHEINQNIYGISFTGGWSKQFIDYLNLQILKENGEMHSKTFFKKTDRNGYIPTNSCHRPKWVGNIPKRTTDAYISELQ